jgi:hypothetical protein
MYEFIELLAPHLPRKLVRETEKLEAQDEVDRVMADLRIPLRDSTPARESAAPRAAS